MTVRTVPAAPLRLRGQGPRRRRRAAARVPAPGGRPGWDPFLDALAERHTVYAPDHPGTARPRATRSIRSPPCGTSSSSTTSCSTPSGSTACRSSGRRSAAWWPARSPRTAAPRSRASSCSTRSACGATTRRSRQYMTMTPDELPAVLFHDPPAPRRRRRSRCPSRRTSSRSRWPTRSGRWARPASSCGRSRTRGWPAGCTASRRRARGLGRARPARLAGLRGGVRRPARGRPGGDRAGRRARPAGRAAGRRRAARARLPGRMTLEHVAGGLMFPEGPLWRDGRLLFSDFHALRVQAVEPDGTVATVCEVEGQPSGLGFDTDGRMLVVSMLDRRLLRLDPEGLTEVADLTALTGGPCNDMVVDRSGRAWVGEFGYDYGAPVRTARHRPRGPGRRGDPGRRRRALPQRARDDPRTGRSSSPRRSGSGSPPSTSATTAGSARRVPGRRSPRAGRRGSRRRSRAARSRRTGSASTPRARSGSPTWRAARRCACSRAAR